MKDRARTTGRPLLLTQDSTPGDSVQGADYTVTSTKDGGGLVLTSIEVAAVFWGSYWSQKSPAPSPDSDTYYQAFVGLVTGPYMTGLRQYRGVGPGTMLGKFVNDTPPDPVNGYSNDDVTNMLVKLFQANPSVPAPVAGHTRFYAVVTPPGINNVDSGDVGQHRTFTYNGITAFYAWVDSQGALQDTASLGVVNIFSHELVEAATDPNVSGGIIVNGTKPDGTAVTNDEIADTCNSKFAIVQMNGIKCNVQCYWSAADNACVIPLGSLSFLVNKNTFGRDEVQEAIKTSGGVFGSAFWIALDDFSITTFDSFKVQVPTPAGPFTNVQGVSVRLSPSTATSPNPVYEDQTNKTLIQRIRFSYDVVFSAPLSTPFPTSGATPFPLTATFTANGDTVPGPNSSDAIDFDLVAGADPYFSNIDPAENNAVFWLSRDLRVFSLARGSSALPGDVAAPTFGAAMSPYDYLQALLGHLNATAAFTAPGAGTADPLDALPGQAGVETGVSSVTPLDPTGQPNSVFAIARVRLTSAAQGTASAATKVRVFFRLWVAASCDTDFDPTSTYLSTPAYPALPTAPLASATNLPPDPRGAAIRTVPYFATDTNGSRDYDPSVLNNNIHTLQVPVGASQDTVWTYYGAFVDVYNAQNQARYPGTHHCLAAQIAYDGSPLLFAAGTATNPGNSDKLAQRNLYVATSGNPGPKPTHRVPQAFDTRPSPGPTFGADGAVLNVPDELMVDWGQVPQGTRAHIFWPDVLASDVLALSARRYGPGRLTVEDAHTIAFDAVPGGVSYIPIPAVPVPPPSVPRPAATATAAAVPIQSFAGLFTIDLPLGVRRGQEFNVLVRRVTTQSVNVIKITSAASAGSTPAEVPIVPAAASRARTWRIVTGAFQVKIPVTTERRMLGSEVNTLAIMKARLQAMAQEYRWTSVVKRYVEYVSARVDGAGGNAAKVPPSLNGWPPEYHYGGGHDDGDDDDDVGHGHKPDHNDHSYDNSGKAV